MPTLEPSKNYAFDFKGKIVAKNILRFHQLSGPIGNFCALGRLLARLSPPRKVPSLLQIDAFFRCEINDHGGPGGLSKSVDFIDIFVGQNQKSFRMVP
ncbi:hypothetical protein AB6802_15520 [Mesorhizobium sp. RCC_202]|uniref:hypothetical protein n=1 Tax=Mesorhizobium sp. RCC_202 TaxID=3239222 RepID=UPI003524D4DC